MKAPSGKSTKVGAQAHVDLPLPKGRTIKCLSLSSSRRRLPASEATEQYGLAVAQQFTSAYQMTGGWATAPSRPTRSGLIAGDLNLTGGSSSSAHAADVIDAGRAVYLEIVDRAGDGEGKRVKMLSLASAIDKSLPTEIRNELYEFVSASKNWSQPEDQSLSHNEHCEGASTATASEDGPANEPEPCAQPTSTSVSVSTSVSTSASASAAAAGDGGGSAAAIHDTEERPAVASATLDNYTLTVSYTIAAIPSSGQQASGGSVELVEADGHGSDGDDNEEEDDDEADKAAREAAAAEVVARNPSAARTNKKRLQIFTVGRSDWNDFVLPDNNVSRLHFVAFCYPGGVVLVDGWSFHGTAMTGRENQGLGLDTSIPQSRAPMFIPHGESVTVSVGPYATFTFNPKRCVVCMENARDVRFSCDHCVSCSSCAHKLRECPVCRQQLDASQSLFGRKAAANCGTFKHKTAKMPTAAAGSSGIASNGGGGGIVANILESNLFEATETAAPATTIQTHHHVLPPTTITVEAAVAAAAAPPPPQQPASNPAAVAAVAIAAAAAESLPEDGGDASDEEEIFDASTAVRIQHN